MEGIIPGDDILHGGWRKALFYSDVEVTGQNSFQKRLLFQMGDKGAGDRVVQLTLVVAAFRLGDFAIETFGVFGELHFRRQDEWRKKRHVHTKDDWKTFLFLFGEECNLFFANAAERIVERDEVDAVYDSRGKCRIEGKVFRQLRNNRIMVAPSGSFSSVLSVILTCWAL